MLLLLPPPLGSAQTVNVRRIKKGDCSGRTRGADNNVLDCPRSVDGDSHEEEDDNEEKEDDDDAEENEDAEKERGRDTTARPIGVILFLVWCMSI